MRFVTIEIGCDWTDCDVRHPEGSDEFLDTTIAVNKKTPKRLTLCLKHNDALHEILDPVLARGVAEAVEKPARASRAKTQAAVDGNGNSNGNGTVTIPASTILVCRVEGCGRDDLSGNVGLAQHLKKKHQMTIAQHDELPTG